MEINALNAAIIGCGVISDIYIQSLQEKFKIIAPVACYDRDELRMNTQAEKYGLKPMSYEAILNDPSIDMIINLTNPAAHYEVTKQALLHDKHVFSEKMIAVDLKQGQELCDLAEAHYVRLGVAPDTFLGAGIQTARYIVDKGLIGTPLSAVVSLNRDFDVYADIFPHMNQAGGSLPFDTGCYYMTALANILGPAKRVTSFGRKYQPERVGKRVDKPWFGEKSTVAADNILTAVVEYANGTLATVHFNSENILTEVPQLDIYGSDGTLNMGDPNNFDSQNYLQKPQNERTAFPFTHGYRENSRGLGAADMAWAIRQDRPHRASMTMAYHVFELIHGMYISATTGQIYELQSTFDRPEALPTGYVDRGFWGPTQESALVF